MRIKRLEMSLFSGGSGLAMVFVAALLVRVCFVLSLSEGFYFPDSTDYFAAAFNLIRNGEFDESYHRAPVYPLFLAGIFIVFGQQILTVRLIEAVAGACLAVVIAAIGRRIAGDKVGAIAGLIWSFYPLGIFIVGNIYPTNIASLLLGCAVLCFVTQANKGLNSRRVFLGGIWLGLTALVLPVALFTAATVTLWLLYWGPNRRFILVASLIGGLSLPVVPWTLRNFDVYGHLVIVEPRLTQHLPRVGDEKTHDGAGGEVEKITAILRNPGEYAFHWLREFGYFWELYPQRIQMTRTAVRQQLHTADSRIVRETVFGTLWTTLVSILSVTPVLFFSLIGAGIMMFQKDLRLGLTLLAGTILSFAVGYSLFVGKIRYRIPVEPYIIILSAYGIRQVWLALALKYPALGRARSSMRLISEFTTSTDSPVHRRRAGSS